MDEAFIKKVQPNSPEAEQSVIGAMIMDRDAIADVIDIVNADDFYQKQNGILFEAMTELYREGKPVDLVTLQNKLKKKDVPESMKSLEFIRIFWKLFQRQPMPNNTQRSSGKRQHFVN